MPNPIKLPKRIEPLNIEPLNVHDLSLYLTPSLWNDDFLTKPVEYQVRMYRDAFNAVSRWCCETEQVQPGFAAIFVPRSWSGTVSLVRADVLFKAFKIARDQTKDLIAKITRSGVGRSYAVATQHRETFESILYQIRSVSKGRRALTIGSVSGCLSLIKAHKDPHKRKYLLTTDGAYLTVGYQGRGLMLDTYRSLVKRGIVLRSGSEHSAGGMRLWQRLSESEGVFVYAWDCEKQEAMHAFNTGDERGFLTTKGPTHECGQTAADAKRDRAYDKFYEFGRSVHAKVVPKREAWMWVDESEIMDLLDRDDVSPGDKAKLKRLAKRKDQAQAELDDIQCQTLDGFMMAIAA